MSGKSVITMEGIIHLPNIRVSRDDIENDAIRLLGHVKPKWDPKEIQMSVRTLFLK